MNFKILNQALLDFQLFDIHNFFKYSATQDYKAFSDLPKNHQD